MPFTLTALGRSTNASIAGLLFPVEYGSRFVRHTLVAPPKNLEEIPARVLEVDRLAERARFGVAYGPFEGNPALAKDAERGLEACAGDGEPVAESVCSPKLVLRRHRHEIARERERYQVVLKNDRLMDRAPLKGV